MDDPLPLPPDATSHSGRTLIYLGLAQTDLDMAHHQLLNLDDSNLGGGAPPTITPPNNEFLHSWDATAREWGHYPVTFSLIDGALTPAQQRTIQIVGQINEGIWNGSPITASHLPTLDLIRAPLGDLSMANHKITNLAAPSAPSDAVTLGYVTAILPGLKIKEAVQCATTTNIALAGLQTIDGFPVLDQQRVLVKNQTLPRQNGIWRAQAGAGWLRAPDSDAPAEVNQAYCFVRNGTINADTAWVQTNNVTNLAPPYGTPPGDDLHYVFFSEGTVGPPGPPGPGLPPDGSSGQFLAKIDGTPYNTHWISVAYQPLGSVPAGGIVGQVLVKNASADYNTRWDDLGVPTDGNPGDVLVKIPGAPGGRQWITSPSQVPPYGHVGQILTKNTEDPYGCEWDTILQVPSDGTNGDVLVKNSGHVDGCQWITSPSQVPNGGLTGQVLTKLDNVLNSWNVNWRTPAPGGVVYNILQSAQLSPAGTVSTIGVMMGLARLFTPFSSGKVIVTIAGWISSNNAGGSAGASIRVGTGAAPTNNDPLTGISVGAAALRGPIGTNEAVPFSLTAALSSLTPGTQIWIDLAVAAGAPGTATVGALTVSAWEIP